MYIFPLLIRFRIIFQIKLPQVPAQLKLTGNF